MTNYHIKPRFSSLSELVRQRKEKRQAVLRRVQLQRRKTMLKRLRKERER